MKRVHVCCLALLLPGAVQSQSGPTQAELDAASTSADWLMINHDYAGRRFVDLAQIAGDDVARL